MITITITITKYKNNNNSNEKEYNKTEREIKPKKRQVMHNAIAHHPLTDIEQRSTPSGQRPPVYIHAEHDVLWYGVALWLVRVSCPGRAPSQLLVHLRAGRAWETEKSLT